MDSRSTAPSVRRGKNGKPEVVPWPPGYPVTGFEWAVAPSVLWLVPTWLHERYKLPVAIVENGVSVRDWVSADGAVHDPARIDFTARYLRELAATVAVGVPIEAYFHWSVLDNFEWAEGYKQRFGLVYVDYATGKRTLKDSALWYRDVIASNGKTLLNIHRPTRRCTSAPERHRLVRGITPAPVGPSRGRKFLSVAFESFMWSVITEGVTGRGRAGVRARHGACCAVVQAVARPRPCSNAHRFRGPPARPHPGRSRLAFVVFGIFTFSKLKIEAFPDVTNVQVMVITLYPDRPRRRSRSRSPSPSSAR